MLPQLLVSFCVLTVGCGVGGVGTVGTVGTVGEAVGETVGAHS